MLIESATQNELLDTMKSTIEAMEESYEDFGYYCDGVVFEINNRELFNSMGVTGNHRDGNIALKVGIWKQDQYPGYVQAIMWTKGKSKMSPVAIVADLRIRFVLTMTVISVTMMTLGINIPG